VLGGIIYVLRAGVPWRLLPAKELGCGSGVTCGPAMGACSTPATSAERAREPFTMARFWRSGWSAPTANY
jgi:transposase